MKYTAHCGYCNERKTGINSYFCIKNTGSCEDCYAKARYLKRKIRKSNPVFNVVCCKCGVSLEGRKMNNRKATCTKCQKENMDRHNKIQSENARRKKLEKKAKQRKFTDHFNVWNKKRRPDETVDKKPPKLA